MVMPTRNVVLTDSQAKFVEQMVASGHYQNASEVLREGLRLVQAREAEQAARLAKPEDTHFVNVIPDMRYNPSTVVRFGDRHAYHQHVLRNTDHDVLP
jgi:putative addiction module CopG family antidote